MLVIIVPAQGIILKIKWDNVYEEFIMNIGDLVIRITSLRPERIDLVR